MQNPESESEAMKFNILPEIGWDIQKRAEIKNVHSGYLD